jgi:hypothetical protein
LESDDELKDLIQTLPELLSILGSMTQGIKFVNNHQILAMTQGKSEYTIESFPKWTVTGGLFGDPKMVTAAKKIIQQKMKGRVHTLFFVDAAFFQKYKKLVVQLPLPKRLRQFLEIAGSAIDLFQGKPSVVALPIAYLGSGVFPVVRNDADPGKDGAGIIWFAPLIPMEGVLLKAYIELVEHTLKKYKLPQMVTFTTINDRCFDAPISLVFNKDDEESVKNAKACYGELWDESKKLGILPYRIPIDEQHRVTESGTSFWNVVEKIKDSLDPNNIISPKRYSKK